MFIDLFRFIPSTDILQTSSGVQHRSWWPLIATTSTEEINKSAQCYLVHSKLINILKFVASVFTT
jgi:hypothetical protein